MFAQTADHFPTEDSKDTPDCWEVIFQETPAVSTTFGGRAQSLVCTYNVFFCGSVVLRDGHIFLEPTEQAESQS